jgi:arylsulfatase
MPSFTRRQLLQAGSVAAGSVAGGPVAASDAAAQETHSTGQQLSQSNALPPNVLWIMTDQQRFDCLGAHGNALIRTPHLDQLHASSAAFDNCFVQAPVCVPSRVSFFTSRYPHSHRNRVNYTPCQESEVFLQRHFQSAGYQTGAVGKLHYYPPTREHALTTGFDRVELDDGTRATNPYSDYVRWRKQHDPRADIFYDDRVQNPEPGQNPFEARIDAEYTQTAWTGLKTREMLTSFAGSRRPFFLFSSFFKPHSPFTVAEPWASMYNQQDIPLPPRETLESLQQLPLPLQRLILRGTPAYDMDPALLQWMYRSTYGLVSQIDHEVGDILNTLEQTGLAANTIVVFCSDHGAQLLEHGLTDKNVFFESSIHVPLLVRFPRHIAPAQYAQLIEAIDVMPTLLELCGIPIPYNAQGRSFASLLKGNPETYQPRDAVFSENIIPEVITTGSLQMAYAPGEGVAGIRHPDAKVLRTERWKLTHYPGHGGELYDLSADPGETKNLYRDPAHQATVVELRTRLLDWMITADETDQIARHWLL